MDLKDIATISGKGGLFRIIKPTRIGFVLQTLDKHQKRIVSNPTQKVSILEEITIYTTTEGGNIELGKVFDKIYYEFGEDTGIDGSADQEELRAFFSHIVPEHDHERVYTSDIKKIITWYKILRTNHPELFINKEEKPAQKTKKT